MPIYLKVIWNLVRFLKLIRYLFSVRTGSGNLRYIMPIFCPLYVKGYLLSTVIEYSTNKRGVQDWFLSLLSMVPWPINYTLRHQQSALHDHNGHLTVRHPLLDPIWRPITFWPCLSCSSVNSHTLAWASFGPNKVLLSPSLQPEEIKYKCADYKFALISKSCSEIQHKVQLSVVITWMWQGTI